MKDKRSWTAAELAALKVGGWPTTEQRMHKRLLHTTAKSIDVACQGGRNGKRREYLLSSLPDPLRDAALAHELNTTAATALTPVSVQNQPLDAAALSSRAASLPAGPTPAGFFIPRDADLTDAQRHARDARRGVVAAIRRYQRMADCSEHAAIGILLALMRSGQADDLITASLDIACDRRGRSAPHAIPSARTLMRWMAATDLTPRIPQRDLAVPQWLRTFLAAYQQPQKPTVAAAYEAAFGDARGAGQPSVHQVRRWLAKLGTVTRERGRMGPRELKNLQPFVRRDFSMLEPNDIWTADGHTFDAEVQHPMHGRPFRPEITTIIDVATRRAVGWSVDLAESGTAVIDALRCAVTRAGVPAIFYTDRGSGYINKTLKAPETGLLGRLGTEIVHSLPYNSQARGVIERSHQTIWVQGARQLPGYIGAAMDREARLQQFKLTRRALKGGGALPLMPWDLFTGFVAQRIDWYNARAHRSLKGTSPDLIWKNFVARGWQAHAVADTEIDTLFRPRAARKVLRGEINLFNNRYFSRDLTEFHGTELHVGYDIHDPARIWVYTPEGRLICTAECDGNKRHYMPVAVVQQARERRAKGRLARVDAKRNEIYAELHGAAPLAAPASSQIVIGGRVLDAAALMAESAAQAASAAPPCAPAPRSRSAQTAAENYAEWLALDAQLRAGEAIGEDAARWHRSYQQSAQFRVERARTHAAPENKTAAA